MSDVRINLFYFDFGFRDGCPKWCSNLDLTLSSGQPDVQTVSALPETNSLRLWGPQEWRHLVE